MKQYAALHVSMPARGWHPTDVAGRSSSQLAK
jgi:hypothetical protein